MSKRGERYNDSGCLDTTAFKAVVAVTTEEMELKKKVGKFIKIIKLMAETFGFEIDSRIKIVDKKTGKRFE